MKGSIKERSPGHFAIILDQRDPETGKRHRKWHSFKGTKRAAQIECSRLITEMQGGTYIEPNKLTTAQFLDRWLTHIKTQVTGKTHERYAGIVHQNLIPALGATRLKALKPVQISTAYAAALEGGRRDGKPGGLAPRTVGHMHRVFKQALGQAVIWRELNFNPAEAVDPPKVQRKAMQTYDLPDTLRAIEYFRGSQMLIPVVLASMCGLREGEVCAVRWRHLTGATLTVVESLEQTKAGLRFKTPKNEKGRPVSLLPMVVEELRAHRLRRAQELLRLGIGLSDDDLIVAQPDGSLMTPMYVSQTWGRKIKKSGLRPIRFHNLRHTHATHLLAANVHPKIVSERLGHSKISITLDLYSHVIPGMQEDAAATLEAAFKAVGSQSEKVAKR